MLKIKLSEEVTEVFVTNIYDINLISFDFREFYFKVSFQKIIYLLAKTNLRNKILKSILEKSIKIRSQVL